MNTAALIAQVVLATAGFVAGFLLGRVERMTAEGKTARQRWTAIARVVFGIVVVTVVVVSYLQDRARVECQRSWFEQATAALRERSDAAGASAVDQVTLLRTSLAGDPVRARQATEDYIAAVLRLEAVRKDTPIPAPPEC